MVVFGFGLDALCKGGLFDSETLGAMTAGDLEIQILYVMTRMGAWISSKVRVLLVKWRGTHSSNRFLGSKYISIEVNLQIFFKLFAAIFLFVKGGYKHKVYIPL